MIITLYNLLINVLINGGRWWNVTRFAIISIKSTSFMDILQLDCNISLFTSLERPLWPYNKSSIRNLFRGSIYPYGRNSEKTPARRSRRSSSNGSAYNYENCISR